MKKKQKKQKATHFSKLRLPSKFPNNWNDFFRKNIHLIILALLTTAFIIFYTTISFLRYDNFYTGRMDLGNMTQTVWNTAHGRIFQMTSNEETFNMSRLAYHADFILMLFAPIYWVFDTPKVLLTAQVLIAGLGAIFVYLISQHVLKKKWLSLAFVFAYVMNPSLSWSVLFDFHSVVLATTFILGAIYFFLKKQYKWFLVFAILAGITKEQVWIIIALFGPLFFFVHKKRLFGTLLFFIPLGIFYYLFYHAIPQASMVNGYFALTYFDESGSSLTDLLKNSLMNPGIFVEEKRLEYYQALLLPLGYLPFAFPFWMVFPGADLALSILSDKEELQQITFHYTAAITPFLFLSGIYGVKVLIKVLSRWKQIAPYTAMGLILYIFSFTLIGAYIYGPLPGTQYPNDEMLVAPVEHKDEIMAKLREIPLDKSVASTNELGAHLSHRERIYTMGIDVREADYVAFFTHNPDPNEDEFNTELKIQMKNDTDYELWYDKYGLIIFRKK